jgi:hypothetical protein
MMMPIVSDAEQRIRSVKGCACRFVLKGVCSSTRMAKKIAQFRTHDLTKGLSFVTTQQSGQVTN